MKKIKFFIVFVLFCFLGLNNVKAVEYQENSNGKYVVDSGYCTYNFAALAGGDYQIKILFENDNYKSIETGLGKYGETVHFDSLKYSDFFTNDSKKFSCPKQIYVNYLPVGDGSGRKTGYHLESMCDDEIIGKSCAVATNNGDNVVSYAVKTTNNPEVKETSLVCSYKKNIMTSGSSSYQRNSKTTLIYKKYIDGTQEFIDGSNKKYVANGNLDSCLESIYTTVSSDGSSYTIVNSCNENTNSYCVPYRLESLTNPTDSNMNEDGTSSKPKNNTIVIENNIDLTGDEGACSTYLGSSTYDPSKKIQDPAYYLQFAFNLIKYAAIVALLILTVIDFAKAMASDKDDALKATIKKTIKRLIIALVIFFLPIFIKFILDIVGITGTGTCTIK